MNVPEHRARTADRALLGCAGWRTTDSPPKTRRCCGVPLTSGTPAAGPGSDQAAADRPPYGLLAHNTVRASKTCGTARV